MKSILVVNDSPLLRDYLAGQLTDCGFRVQKAANGFDGWTRIRQRKFDLIIMDYILSRKTSLDLLTEIADNPNIASVPVVMFASKLEKSEALEIAKFGVSRILSKPVRIDALLNAVTELLGVAVNIDSTPCIVDAHLNDEILFVEIARGLNREKINLLRYKIAELIELYSVMDPRILVLITDLAFRNEDEEKLHTLMQDILAATTSPDRVRVLTVSGVIKSCIASDANLADIEVVESLEAAMEGLWGIRGIESLTAEQDNVRERYFSSKQEIHSEAFQLNFQKERSEAVLQHIGGKIRVAVVDDDAIVREIIGNTFTAAGWEIAAYANGLDFVEALEEREDFDLLFLDLIMPKMNGFAVLQAVNGCGVQFPIIILTALSRRESVIKARELGVRSYLIKPIKPDGILSKAAAILGANF